MQETASVRKAAQHHLPSRSGQSSGSRPSKENNGVASRPPAAAASNHSSSSAKKKASRSRSEQSNDRLQGTEGTVVCAKPNYFGSSSLFFLLFKRFFSI